MRKFVVPPCFAITFLLCCFMPLDALQVREVKNTPAENIWLETIETYAVTNKWKHLAHITKSAIEEGLTLTQVREVAEKTGSEPFMRALNASSAIRKTLGNVGIGKGELFRIALFIETELEETRHSLKTNYLSRRNTGLDRTLECDPDSGLVFIHLKNHGVDEIGRGVKKVVTKSILYDVKNPEYAARCISESKMGSEMMALKLMQGSRGILKLHSYSERTNKRGQKIHSMICKLYKGGSLAGIMSHGVHFSFRQKLQITKDLLEGLSAMQAKGLIHRDLTAANVFIDATKKNVRNRRAVSAVIADFGRTRHIDKSNGVKVQFNSRYLCPEGIIAEKLAGEDYYATDLFALGCIFHKLHYEKSGPWVNKANLKNPTQPDAVKEARFIYDLEHYREVRLSKLSLGSSFGFDASPKDRFETLILQLVHQDPKSRGTAKEHLQTIKNIISDYQEKARQKQLTPEQEQEEQIAQEVSSEKYPTGLTDISEVSYSGQDVRDTSDNDFSPEQYSYVPQNLFPM